MLGEVCCCQDKSGSSKDTDSSEVGATLGIAFVQTDRHHYPELGRRCELVGADLIQDSKVALFWIQGIDKSWKPFVHNRVTEIRGHVPPDYWTGAENPADVPSRGATPLELSANLLWHYGPTWLMEKNPQVPEPDLPMPQACLEEMKAKDIKLVQGLLTTSQAAGIRQLMKSEDSSTLDRLLNVTSQVLRFCQTMKSKIDPRISLDEDKLRARAEILWIKEAQRTLIDDKHF